MYKIVQEKQHSNFNGKYRGNDGVNKRKLKALGIYVKRWTDDRDINDDLGAGSLARADFN